MNEQPKSTEMTEITEEPLTEPKVVTLGCRLNAWESAVITRHLRQLELALIVVNSCTVTAEAERQTRQKLRQLRRLHPNAKIIATGCAVTLAPKRWAALDAVDAVLENQNKLQPQAWIDLALQLRLQPQRKNQNNTDNSAANSAANSASVSDGTDRDTAILEAHHAAPSPTRAYVEIQHGCDHRCTFCTIPFARGDNRSIAIERIIARARRLVEGGTKEIILTGVDIASWGSDLEGRPALASAITHLLEALPELLRLRLSSLDPAALNDDFFNLLAREERLQPHLHLSVQAGEDLILKRMKRRHSTADLRRIVARLRAARPGLALGADLIAGFPTESDEMFERGYALFAELEIPFLHVFPYSVRPATPAGRMPQVAAAQRRLRAARLRALGQDLQRDYVEQLVGQRRSALCEGGQRARIGENLPIVLPLEERPGRVIEVTLAPARLARAKFAQAKGDSARSVSAAPQLAAAFGVGGDAGYGSDV